jgi:hypothetical protein
MKDAAFFAPPADVGRPVTGYGTDPESGALRL